MKQITVICKDCKNPVQKITTLLSKHNIDIRNIGFQQFGTDAILNLITDDFEKSITLLSEHGYTLLSDETLLIKATDRLGMLAEMSQQISDAGVTIRSLALIKISEDNNVVAVSTNDNPRVRGLYRDQLIN